MSLERKFNRAAEYLQSVASDLDSEEQLVDLYAFYKQATIGPCNTKEPTKFTPILVKKWRMWKSLGDMSHNDAMKYYLLEVDKLNPDWDKQSDTNWVVISRLISMEDEISDADKTFLDWVKEGHEEKVQELLDKKPKLANLIDSEGLLPIHWAADRGYLEIIQKLIEKGTDVNAQDEDGQTPLHYAVSCGHHHVVEHLVSIGAEFIEDNNGISPKDIAGENFKEIL
ncbi:Acyl-CoA-binding domain-containing protein 6 [Melipona quadrifasciata]|uniref:Acyl-CoA-binding domain-containing protein 6 n=1 Tax=Melipona quadrifasciata TaxID=166423 RepID=A0A0M8ZMX5_9HYME|nr:Acyl-CoA-binding domain-containing protein 6 [Melipona quadrifasciata]